MSEPVHTPAEAAPGSTDNTAPPEKKQRTDAVSPVFAVQLSHPEDEKAESAGPGPQPLSLPLPDTHGDQASNGQSDNKDSEALPSLELSRPAEAEDDSTQAPSLTLSKPAGADEDVDGATQHGHLPHPHPHQNTNPQSRQQPPTQPPGPAPSHQSQGQARVTPATAVQVPTRKRKSAEKPRGDPRGQAGSHNGDTSTAEARDVLLQRSIPPPPPPAPTHPVRRPLPIPVGRTIDDELGEETADQMMALLVEIGDLKEQAKAKRNPYWRFADDAVTICNYVFNAGRGDTAVHFLEMLAHMTMTEPNFTELNREEPPRQLTETYTVDGSFDLQSLYYYHQNLKTTGKYPIGTAKSSKMTTLAWYFQSSWQWENEQCHDAHLAETMRGCLSVGGERIVEYFSYNKPLHHQYGGGRVDQRWLVLHKSNLLRLRQKVAPHDDLFSFLLFITCGGQHRSPTKGVRYSLHNLIAQAGPQNIQVPYRQITIVMSDERGNPKKTRRLGSDPHTGAEIPEVTDSWSFPGWLGCDPPPPSIR